MGSQDTASRERGDFVKLNDTKGNVKDELENNQNIKIRTSMLEMNHNDIDGTSTDELHKEEDKEVIKPQLEMEMATANHKITEELSDNIVNKEENNDIEIVKEESFMAEETPRHGQESDIITSSNEISKDKTVESDSEKEGHVDPSLCLDYQCPTPPPCCPRHELHLDRHPQHHHHHSSITGSYTIIFNSSAPFTITKSSIWIHLPRYEVIF